MKNKRRVPFGTIHIPPKSIELINAALTSGRVSSGRMVSDFEKRFAELIGSKHAVALSTGTDADTLALAVYYDYGAKRGDEVIVPSLSFVATGNAVLHAGFTPVFVDIERDTLNIDPSKIEAAVTDRTVAIMPVHLMGKPAKMDAIMKIAKKCKIRVVEDAAEAHGGTLHGKPLGTIGEMGAFSTYVAHIITTIEGGVVTTDNADYAGILRSLRSHGRACKCDACSLNVTGGYCAKRFAKPELGDIRFIFERVGYSSKMNELEAAVGLGNLDNYEEIVRIRHGNLMAFIGEFKRFAPFLKTISEDKGEVIGPHALPVVVQESAPFTRDQLVSHLEKNGVDTRSLFQSMPTQCPGFAFLGYKTGQFPNAEYMGTHGLHIGVHHDMTGEDVAYVIDCFEEFVGKYR